MQPVRKGHAVRIRSLSGGLDLTYCTNIYAGETWPEVAAALDEHVPAIRRELGMEERLGIGLRLSGVAAAALAEAPALAAFRAQLDRLGAYVFTVNAFPYGPFHGVAVKEQVYQPDWRSPERLRFTCQVAGILAQLLPPGGFGTISTVPGAFRTAAGSAAARAEIVAGLVAAAAALVRIGREQSRHIVLALEPEPACLLETVEDTLAFFADHLFGADAVARMAALTGLAPGPALAALRSHLGVCYDVCHGAVVFENPLLAIRRLRAAGIRVAKIQLSAAIRVPAFTPEAAELLPAFDDGVYLHQTTVRTGQALRRFTDLPEALAVLDPAAEGGEVRVHCHVPLYLPRLGALETTQADLLPVLDAAMPEALAPHLEVETYTWDVLPRPVHDGGKAQGIARELRFVLDRLAEPAAERAA